MHPHFKNFLAYPNWSPAMMIMTEMMRNYVDVDGNFVQQFQSNGFDARLWELYLYAYLKEERLFFDREYSSPDYVVKKFGLTVCIEAMTVNPSGNFYEATTDRGPPEFKSPEEARKLLDDFMPIKFGSALFSKLSKNPPYWELEHVTDKPLVFAIADFHGKNSMIWSSTALFEYLYGVRHDFHFDDEGQLVFSEIKIDTHKVGNKEIASGFFSQPNVENVSAVLFSNSGTISKFNRMGRLAGFGIPNMRLIRQGVCHDHNPNAYKPKPFVLEIEPGKATETWGEGLSMYHNPNALNPVPRELFPSIAHHEFQDSRIVSMLPDFHPYWSVTNNILLKD